MSKESKGAHAQPAQTFEFKAEIQQLLNILIHSLYTEREIFLRELLSNASDALNRIQFEMLTNHEVLDPDAELAIQIETDQAAGTLTISDTGIGMTREEIARDLGTIAHSGAAAFLKQLETEQRPSLELIGQFGVGFYSVFMVADQVRVVSRSYRPDAEAVEWISEGGTSYHLGSAEKSGRGTRIEIKLKEDAAEFAAAWRLEQIIRKHSDYIAFPIYVGDSKKAVNQKTALWRQSPRQVTDEQYDDFYRYLTLDPDKPLLHTHLVTDAPVNLRSLLYIPAHRERGFLDPRTDHGLKLYVHNVMIQEYNKDLLPGYLRFVEGVVESEDLPLNISREVIQSSPAVRHIQKALVRKLIKELEALSESTPEAYASFWDEFGPFIKEGVAAIPAGEPAVNDDLLPLLRFHSSRAGGELVSLAQYLERMSEDQHAIYYVLGDDLKSVAQSPHLDYFRARDVEVLYLVDPIDSFLAMALTEHEGKPFKNVDSAGLELPQEKDAEQDVTERLPDPDFNRLVGRFVKVLGARVLEVRESKVLRDSPCRLVSPDDAPAPEMSRVYRMLGQEFEVPKRILEINRSHPIIVNLAHLVADTPETDLIDVSIEQLFDNLLLVEGLHPNPTIMIPRIQQLLEAATAGRRS